MTDNSSTETVHKSGFYPFIHVLRGIAPLMVVWAHLAMYFLYDHKIFNSRLEEWWRQFALLPFHLYYNAGHLGVVIFFFVSGFIITHTSLREGHREFAIKRFFRIFPVLAAALLVVALVRWAAAHLGIGNITGTAGSTPLDYIRALFLIDMVMGYPQILVVTWSLVSEVIFYLLTFCALSATRKDPFKATWLMVAIWAVVHVGMAGFKATDTMRYFTIYVPFLLMGRTLYLADTKAIGWDKAIALLLCLGMLFVLFYTSAFPGQLMIQHVEPAASYLMGFIAFLMAMTYGVSRVPRVLAFFADLSLSLYLLHIPVGMFVITLAYGRGVRFSLALALGFAAATLASYVSFRWLEMPCQRLARRLCARRS